MVAEIQSERPLVESNRKLIEIFERMIESKLAELWGENVSPDLSNTGHPAP